MWQDARLRDFWGMVMDYTPWREFIIMRGMCMLWYKKSLDNQRLWYSWLEWHGKSGGYHYDKATHKDYRCSAIINGELCKDHRHYLGIEKIPRILKTVPLSKQALSQMAKRHQKELKAQLAKAVMERDKFEMLVRHNRAIIEDCKQKLLVVDRVVEAHASRRKRTHIEINISNHRDEK